MGARPDISGQQGGLVRLIARAAGEVVAETLWPTRCAVCDVPGKVLCERCERSLRYVDWWRACRRCGSPFGFMQCDLCNPVSLGRIGRKELPYAACASATMFDEHAGRIVRVFKDQGEQRLAEDMARIMAATLPPAWPVDAVAFVPATLSAYRFRGYDHAELIARALCAKTGMPLVFALERPKTRDQRALSGSQRVSNLQGSFRARDGAASALRLLLVDDVYTTGATLCAATDALLAADAREVRCLTFARV